MQRISSESPRQRKRRMRAEAAAWLTRLHGDERKAAEREWLRWLSADPDHEAQFKIAIGKCLSTSRRQGTRLSVLSPLAAILAVGVIWVVLYVLYWMPTTLYTGIGEQLKKTLSDGTQVELNTGTHIAVRHGVRRREMVLQSGEVYLNVTQYMPRPFVVFADGRKVFAARASFVVRRDEGSVTPLTVTLIEGCVAIASIRTGASEVALLNPGERVRFRRDGVPIVDQPFLEQITSWRDGKLTFAHTLLAEAVTEFNRYSLFQIAVRSPEAGLIRVNGTFGTYDSFDFVRTVAQAQHMRLQVHGNQLILESIPSGGQVEKKAAALESHLTAERSISR